MNRIDREKLRDNILYFGKIKGLKIGDIERSIGRRLGIVSRWKSKNTYTIPLDDIYNIAIILNITIDELINADTKELRKQQELFKLKQQLELVELKKQREINELRIQYELIDKQIKELEGKYSWDKE